MLPHSQDHRSAPPGLSVRVLGTKLEPFTHIVGGGIRWPHAVVYGKKKITQTLKILKDTQVWTMASTSAFHSGVRFREEPFIYHF